MNCEKAGCDKKASVNFQKVWEAWTIAEDESYVDRRILDGQDPGMEDSLHYCREHGQLWEAGELD